MSPKKQKHKDFESALLRLEEITTLMESGEASLEESIDLYSEGLTIAKECRQQLGAAEKKIKMIVKKAGGTSEEDFANSEDQA